MSKRRQIFGVPLDVLTMEQTVERCRRLVGERRPVQHVVLNAGKVLLARDQPGLAAVIARCEIVNADGWSVVWAGRLLGLPVPERVAGIDLMGRLLDESEREGWPVYFLGARTDVLGRFIAVVRRRHPRLTIAGAHDGYFQDDGAAADAVRDSGARLLFVGISSPRKEHFLAEQLERMGPIFAMGVGGSFDVWAGETRRAPGFMQRSGLEWLYRFAQEPRRLWRRYLLGNLRFVWLVLQTRWRTRRSAA